MFAYCGNNPVMGYDPTGETNWGGFWTGVGMVLIGGFVAAAIIASAGSATPVVAAALTATGTALGSAIGATGSVVAYGAITEEPIVVDISVVDGYTHDKHGYSVVVDFTENSVALDGYYHYGKTSSGYAVAYGAGLVQNYNKPGDYGGPFIDGGGSVTVSGYDYGIDICTGPTEPFSNDTCWAAMATFGVSFPANSHGKRAAYIGYDYYVPIFYLEY